MLQERCILFGDFLIQICLINCKHLFLFVFAYFSWSDLLILRNWSHLHARNWILFRLCDIFIRFRLFSLSVEEKTLRFEVSESFCRLLIVFRIRFYIFTVILLKFLWILMFLTSFLLLSKIFLLIFKILFWRMFYFFANFLFWFLDLTLWIDLKLLFWGFFIVLNFSLFLLLKRRFLLNWFSRLILS